MPIIVDSVQTGRVYNKAGTREFAQCTAWVNFNGTGTVAIRDSLNVSSITDNGAGDYTVNLSQNMDNANYSALFTHGVVNSTDSTIIDMYTVSSVRVRTYGAGAATDAEAVSGAIFGGITL